MEMISPTPEQIKANHALGPDNADAVGQAAEWVALSHGKSKQATHRNSWSCTCGLSYNNDYCTDPLSDLNDIKAMEDEGDQKTYTRRIFDGDVLMIRRDRLCGPISKIGGQQFSGYIEPWNRLHAELWKRVTTGEWPSNTND